MKFSELTESRILQSDYEKLKKMIYYNFLGPRVARPIESKEGRNFFEKKIMKFLIQPRFLKRFSNDSTEYQALDSREKKEADIGQLMRYNFDNDPIWDDVIYHIRDWILTMERENDTRGLKSLRGIPDISQANHMADEYFRKRAKKRSTQEDLGGIKTIYKFSNGFRIVEVKSEQALGREGKLMGHCVGDYCTEVDHGAVKIFSLRDSKNMPHATLEYDVMDKGITQIKGKNNEAPNEKYRGMIREFIRKKNLNVYDDADNVDLFNVSIYTVTSPHRFDGKHLLLSKKEIVDLFEHPKNYIDIEPKYISTISVHSGLDLSDYPKDIKWFDPNLNLDISNDFYISDSEITTLPINLDVRGTLYVENSALSPEYWWHHGNEHFRVKGEPRFIKEKWNNVPGLIRLKGDDAE